MIVMVMVVGVIGVVVAVVVYLQADGGAGVGQIKTVLVFLVVTPSASTVYALTCV